MGLIIFLLMIVTIFAIIGFIKSYKNSDKISALKWELNKLRNQINSLEQPNILKKDKISEETKTQSISTMSDSKTDIKTHILANQDSVYEIQKIPLKSKKDEIDTIPQRKSRTKDEWEVFVGGKLLNRVGALALIIALGYFLKYAFDNNLISETVRVLIGVFIGLLLIVGGYRFYKKDFIVFYQGLVGAGIAILYLSIYSSFNYYNLVSQPVAFGLMSVITIITFIQAFYYKSLTVSLFGWVGGFLTKYWSVK